MPTSEPWRELPSSLADLLEPELPAISDAILRAIGEEVPEYARPLEGAFGRGVRTGVTQALERFLALVRGDEGTDRDLRRAYVALGRDELRAGRTLDALQAAYRVGARVAWRRAADAGAAAGLDHATLARLAEAMFAYIDGLSAESVEGYARAQSELAGERERHRRALAEALLRPATPPEERARLAALAGWPVPRTAAALACRAEDAPGLGRRLGADALPATLDGAGCVVVPDAEGPGRRDALRVAVAQRPAAVGPDLPLERLRDSWRLAADALAARRGAPGLTSADDHLAGVLVHQARVAVARIAERRLAPFAALTPRARARMHDTALAYLQHRGSAPAMARALHVHPQTARYRIARLRELLGDQLDDPDARFELEAALRAAP